MSSRRLGVVATVAAFAIAGCGGGGGSTTTAPTGSAQQLSLQADPSGALRFNKKTLQATSGKVTIVMTNPAPVSHDISIEGAGIDEQGEVIGKGGTSRLTADLEPGTYTFYCSVPGHREAGMQGTLTVK
jgi:plastocyanin